MTCYYCHTQASLTLNNKAMVCELCNDIKGSLSLQKFDTHAFLAFKAGQYTLERFKNISKTIKELITLRRQLSTKKALITRDANSTGWHKRYDELRLKGTGTLPTHYPNATKTNDITQAICDIITWSGGWAKRTGNEGRMIPNGLGGWKRIHGANNGMTDLTGGHPLIGSLAIEVKNKFTKDKWKEYSSDGKLSAQAKYRDSVIAGGAVHYVAVGIEEFIGWWDGLMNAKAR